MSRITVVGDPDFNLGFRLVGIRDIIDVDDEEKLPEIVESLLGREGVVVIKYDFYKKLPIQVKMKVEESLEPTFVKVGGEAGVEELRDKIRRAIGVDLWK
ncbi:V-type ATP synthase subunit F [Archaeoglobus veneficus]|uniref:A-type ATP synthase subunit F n=1 Tax=Archaeoglobus veneficus (strain DSM 11195 / SNP6) TaxID=693661 RepID=F2KP29_ARCVS|nr:V-type ATP synthase subunit F [Archaeoglobus veneficus]AEA46337.1 V-type ATP synthase subunit F [Archaeoglobus veneficus SNP6]